MSFVDANGLKRAFTKLKSLIDKKWNMVGTGDIVGVASSNGNSDIYMKAPIRGILPYSDKASNTSGKTYYLGTPAWPWSVVYADSFVGNLNGNSTTANSTNKLKDGSYGAMISSDGYIAPIGNTWIGKQDNSFKVAYIDTLHGKADSATKADTATKATSADSVPSLTGDDIDAAFTEVFG